MRACGLADGAGAVHDGVLPGRSGNGRSRLHRGPPARRRSAHTRAGRSLGSPPDELTAVRELGTLPRVAGHPAERHAHPPLRTFTVGAGIPPAQPPHPSASGGCGASGSRTVTAGSDFHRPRSTLLTARVQRRSLHGHCAVATTILVTTAQSWTSQGTMTIERVRPQRCRSAMNARRRQQPRTPRRSPWMADSCETRPRPRPGYPGIRARSRRGRRCHRGHRRRSPRS